MSDTDEIERLRAEVADLRTRLDTARAMLLAGGTMPCIVDRATAERAVEDESQP
jgi:hypothetical protein